LFKTLFRKNLKVDAYERHIATEQFYSQFDTIMHHSNNEESTRPVLTQTYISKTSQNLAALAVITKSNQLACFSTTLTKKHEANEA